MPRLGFSYARFSTGEQMDGRSLRRQEEAAKSYCDRHGLILDSRTFRDLGVSGYHGANATHGELATFLELVQDGRIPKGSTLIVENADRLSRLPPHEANTIILAIVNAGVNIATTSPEQLYTRANIGQIGTWIPLQVSQCLAAEESRKKSDRLLDVWASKRETAATEKLSKKGPAWLKLTADRKSWRVLEEKACWVRQAFQWVKEGFGCTQITGKLNEMAPTGLTGRGWQPSYVFCLLRSRSVLGEFQPHMGTCAKKGRPSTRKPHGDAVPNYFPQIVDEDTFYAVQALLSGRKRGIGKMVGTPNLFNGLLHCAADGQTIVLNASGSAKVLVSSGAIRKLPGSKFHSIRYDVFEDAVLSLFAELTSADVLGRLAEQDNSVETLSGQLTTINQKIAQTNRKAAEVDDPDIYLDLLADLAKQKKQTIALLDKARMADASRTADNLGDAVSLIEMLRRAEPEDREELRRKTRAAIKRFVSEIWLLIVVRGDVRLCAVQVFFTDAGRHRDYLVRYKQARANQSVRREGGWSAHSLADIAKLGPCDLRKPTDARKLEALLAAVDLPKLLAALQQPRLKAAGRMVD
jgi:DNA invertase Pin-like site-specific DNA recombinase